MSQSNQKPQNGIQAISKQFKIFDELQNNAKLQMAMQKALCFKISVPEYPPLQIGKIISEQFNLSEKLRESLGFGKVLKKALDFKLAIPEFPTLSISKLISDQHLFSNYSTHFDEIKKASFPAFPKMPSIQLQLTDFASQQSLLASTIASNFSKIAKCIEEQIAEKFRLSKFLTERSGSGASPTVLPNVYGLLGDRPFSDLERLGDIANLLQIQDENIPQAVFSSEQCEILDSIALQLPKTDNLFDAVFRLALAIGERSVADKGSKHNYKALFLELFMIVMTILNLICAAAAIPQLAESQRYKNGLDSFHISRTLAAQQKLLYPPNCIVRSDCMASTAVGQNVQSSLVPAGTPARMLNKLKAACEIGWLQGGTPKRGWIEVKNLAFPKL